ncbi:integrase [Streptomyces sp. NBC_01356]|nr:integrase [Streptomyces sp. NBC_01356]
MRSRVLLGHPHIGVYPHLRLRLQRQAIDTLGNALGPPAAAVVR